MSAWEEMGGGVSGMWELGWPEVRYVHSSPGQLPAVWVWGHVHIQPTGLDVDAEDGMR